MAVRSPRACLAGFAILLIGIAGCGSDEVQLSIVSPRDDQTVSFSELRVSGTVEPESATVRVEDKLVPTRNGTFTTTVTLHRGRNRINIAATSSGHASDVREIVVKRGTTRAEYAAASRRRDARRRLQARRTAAAARAALRAGPQAGGRYPTLVRKYFMASCRVQGSAQLCGCTLRYLEARVSLEELQRAEQRLAADGTVPQFATDAYASCT